MEPNRPVTSVNESSSPNDQSLEKFEQNKIQFKRTNIKK